MACSLLGMTVSLAAREGLMSARNRMDRERARWTAEGCLARTRARIDRVLGSEGAPGGRDQGDPWRSLDHWVDDPPVGSGPRCVLRVRVAGERLDANAADSETLRALFTELTGDSLVADSLSDALLDWRDSDSLRRADGAERPWYHGHSLFLPSNEPFRHIEEVGRVRGFELLEDPSRWLSVEPARVSINHAPREVLLALPGITTETADRIVEERRWNEPIGDLIELGERLSPLSRRILIERYAELARTATTTPDAWILTAVTEAGAVRVAVEYRMMRDGRGAAVERRRIQWR